VKNIGNISQAFYPEA